MCLKKAYALGGYEPVGGYYIPDKVVVCLRRICLNKICLKKTYLKKSATKGMGEGKEVSA